MAKVVTEQKGSVGQFIEKVDIMLRSKTLRQAARRGARPIRKRARQLVPVGDPNHKPDNPSLKSTIAIKVKSYQGDRIAVALTGPRYPQGSHGHLIEGGHEVKVSRGPRKGQAPLTGSARVEGKEFMAPAADQTKEEQQAAVISFLREAVEAQAVE